MAQMTDNQVLPFTVQFTDKKGNPTAPPPGATPLAWAVDNPNLGTLTVSPDSLTCSLTAVGPIGTVTVSVATADNSASGSLEVDIVGSAPAKIVITPGTPTEQP